MRVAVMGHVEWVTFARVAHVPGSGEIARATASWQEAAGGGAVAARELARLAPSGHATFFTAIGEDEAGQHVRAALAEVPLELHVASRAEPHPRVFTLIDDAGERTITVLAPPLAPRGEDRLPFDELDATDAVYFCKGDAAAARHARRARVLVATARALATLREARVSVDVLVRSARDGGERYAPGNLELAPRAVVATEGADGGVYETESGEHGRYRAVAPASAIVDTYGAGDTFAAALTFALAIGRPLAEALEFAADRATLALGRRGAGSR